MRGECQICKKVVTPEQVMSNTFYEYSRARFLEQFFYNGENLHNAHSTCGHRSLREINRVFIMPGNYQISFTYIPVVVYQIEMVRPKREDTAELFNREVEMRKIKMADFIESAYYKIKDRLRLLVEFMSIEKRSILTKERQK